MPNDNVKLTYVFKVSVEWDKFVLYFLTAHTTQKVSLDPNPTLKSDIALYSAPC